MKLRHERAPRGLAWLAVVLLLGLVVSILEFGPGTVPAEEDPVARAGDEEVAAESERLPAARALGERGDEAPAPSGETLAFAELEFVDVLGAPVADVRAWASSEAGTEELGDSNALGVLRVACSSERAFELIAKRVGYRDHVVEVTLAPNGRLRLVLEGGASIVGHVVCADASADLGAVNVLAVPISGLPSPEELERAMSGRGSRAHLAEVSASGRFEIHGLDPRRRYWVTGGGVGCLVREPATNVEPGGEEVELQLAWMYGVRIRLVDGEAGGPLRVSSALARPAGVGTQTLDPKLELATYRIRECALGGLPSDELRQVDVHESLWLYLSDEKRASAGPVRFIARVPGYTSADLPIELPPVESHVVTRDVPLRPTAAGWATLKLRFTGAPDLRGLEARPERAFGKLVLFSGGEVLYELHCRSVSAGVSETHLVPSGHYQARFHVNASSYAWPKRPETVVLDLTRGERVLEVPLEDSAALVVTLVDSFSEEHDGPALLRVQREGRRGVDHVRFDSAPYVLQGLAPGEYVVAAMTGATFVAPGREPYRGTIEAKSGELAEIELRQQPEAK